MKDYKVQLVSTGPLTQLPDSQKLFGSLVYMYSEKYGSEDASTLTKALLDKLIHVTLSNIMPLDYFPTPQEYIIDLISENADKETKLKEKRADIKKRSYISIAELEQVLNRYKNCDVVFPYVKLVNRQQLHVFSKSGFYQIPELDSELYSVPTIDLLEISLDEKGREQEKSINTFNFYVQLDDSWLSTNLLNILKEAASTKKTIILGKRSSQGLNTFQIRDISAQNRRCTSASFFLNMGMLIPNEIDFASSTLKLFTSERRPFEIAGGWDKDFIKHYMSFITEGSIISAPSGLAGAGKSVKSPFNPKRDIVFGNAFLYPLSLEERLV